MKDLEALIGRNAKEIGHVVDFDQVTDKVIAISLAVADTKISEREASDTNLFTNWINREIKERGGRYGIGGYNEHRDIYARSAHFNGAEEPRRLHLGIDIWGSEGTKIFNFYDAHVHSFADNAHFGDYGPTIILSYEIEGFKFNVLYGHLSLDSLIGLNVGNLIPKGQVFGEFGNKEENGRWPEHLHMQIIKNMQDYQGDYPGVCKFSEKENYLDNCPDPSIILKYTF